MKRLVFKIIVPIILIAIWMNVAYYPCLKDGQLDLFMYWLIVGCPFGIKALGVIFYPVGFDLSGGVFVLGLNIILGGLIGGFVLIFKMIGIVIEVIKFFLFDVMRIFIPVVKVD